MTEIPLHDQVCRCGHWYDEHEPDGGECDPCGQAARDDAGFIDPCQRFAFDPDRNTPEDIADRGGDPNKWPQHVKDAFPHLFENGRYVEGRT